MGYWYWSIWGLRWHSSYYHDSRVQNRRDENDRRNQNRQDENAKREQNRKDQEFALRKQKYQDQERARQRQAAAEQERRRQQHQKEMEQLRIQEKQQSIARISNLIKQYETENAKKNAQLQELIASEAEKSQSSKMNSEDMQKYQEKQQSILKEIEKEITKVAKIYANNDMKIQDCIDKTNVDEGDIPGFLRLINDGLLFATLSGQAQSDKLCVKLKTFYNMIERECSDQLSIEYYFGQKNLARFTPILAKEDFQNMEDLICEDQESFDELKEFVVEELKEVETVPRKQKMSMMEKRKFKRFCLSSKETWMKDQMGKTKFARESLKESSPKLALFFGTIHDTIEDIQQILDYSSKQTGLNIAQRKAIEMAPQIEKQQQKMIELKESETDLKNDETDDTDDTDESKECHEYDGESEAKMEQYLQSKEISQREFKQDSVSTTAQECNQLQVVALSKLHIVDSIEDKFVSEKYPSVMGSALSVAKFVEHCTMEIVRTHCVVRQSVILARELLKFKPAKPSTDAQPLWNAISDGIVNIFGNAMEMTRISAEFFAFYIRFQQSFVKFVAAFEIDEQMPLIVALECVKQDIRDFSDFKNTVDEKVNKLRESALTTIQKCVAEAAGADAFEKAMSKRKDAEGELRKLNEKYHNQKFGFNDKYQQMRLNQAKLNAELTTNKSKQQSLSALINDNKSYVDQLRQQLKQVQAK